MTAAKPHSAPHDPAGIEGDTEGVVVLRTPHKIVRVTGDWAVHTFLDDDGNVLHSVGFRREPLFSEEDIAESQEAAQIA